ncbi:MAG: AAA family ATPase [Wenzhouxiangella sp.]
MKLLSLTLHGFRRFADKSTLDCFGRTVALLGPNEAGKSSVLEALSLLNHDNAVPREALHRAFSYPEDHVCIEALYEIDANDSAWAREIGLEGTRRITVSKSANGVRYFTPHRAPHGQASHQREVDRIARQLLKDNSIGAPLKKAVEAAQSGLEAFPSDETDEQNVIASCLELISLLESHPESTNSTLLNQLRISLLNAVTYIDDESEHRAVVNFCKKRMPRSILFDSGSRQLQSCYNLQEIVEAGVKKRPKAIDNLTKACGLDLTALWENAKNKADGPISTIFARAHDRLDNLLSEHWAQSKIKARFFLEGTNLKLQIEDPDRVISSLQERSDGLRQFIALLAFTVQEASVQPILLIDEAETHLHYDGQADLIQMPESQRISSKVIFSTHSLGCLPEDLGRGVRIISVDGPNSTFINSFWQDGNIGVSPILYGAGAQTLAFFPVRRAVISEGPSDLLLLPTLLREATTRESLGYQVISGLSEAGPARIGHFAAHGTSVAFVVDGDDGGENLKDQLLAAGIEPSHIRKISGTSDRFQTIEDFIDKKHLVAAVNRILLRHGLSIDRLVPADIQEGEAAASLKQWCESRTLTPIGKRALAYELLDLKSDKPETRLIAARGIKLLQNLDKWVIRTLVA